MFFAYFHCRTPPDLESAISIYHRQFNLMRMHVAKSFRDLISGGALFHGRDCGQRVSLQTKLSASSSVCDETKLAAATSQVIDPKKHARLSPYRITSQPPVCTLSCKVGKCFRVCRGHESQGLVRSGSSATPAHSCSKGGASPASALLFIP